MFSVERLRISFLDLSVILMIVVFDEDLAGLIINRPIQTVSLSLGRRGMPYRLPMYSKLTAATERMTVDIVADLLKPEFARCNQTCAVGVLRGIK